MTDLNQLDKKAMEKADPSGMSDVISAMPGHCRQALDLVGKTGFEPLNRKVRSLIICGMGGSAIAGDILSAWGHDKLGMPVQVNRNYGLPGWAGPEDLALISSYSGDTEESLSAFFEAEKRGLGILGITSGGQLRELCQNRGYQHLIIPGGLPPRGALGHSFFGLAGMLKKLGLLKAEETELRESIDLLDKLVLEYGPESDTKENRAKQLAGELQGYLPIIYSSVDSLWPVARRWTNQINENSKMLSYAAFFPELCHNEIVGWEQLPETRKKAKIVMLKDRDDHRSNIFRAGIIGSIIQQESGGVISIESRGQGLLARMFSLIFLGDMVSLYLAYLNQVDPTPVERIKYLKSKLGGAK
jgi:glucose/mannose-6-phosphate isomerase